MHTIIAASGKYLAIALFFASVATASAATSSAANGALQKASDWSFTECGTPQETEKND